MLTDLDIAAPSGGVAAAKPTTIRYAGTTFDIALMPVCFAAYIPDPFSNPCFFRVGTNFLPVDVKLRVVFLFLAAMFNSA